MNEIEREIRTIESFISKANYQEALKRLRNSELLNREDAMIKVNRIGFLVNIGLGLKDPDIVNEGIIAANKLLEVGTLKKEARVHAYYNRANGYISLYELGYNKEIGIKQVVDNENLQKAKYNFREAIKEATDSNYIFEELPRVLTNYGNCLDLLGRTVEAFNAYDKALKINPNFSMALGNKAKAMCFFADVSGAYREQTYIKAYQMLMSIIEKSDLIMFGGPEAKKKFERIIEQIKKHFKNKSILQRKLKVNKYKISKTTSFEKFYIDFCLKHNLFLNFRIFDNENEASITDPLFIRMIAPIEESSTVFYNLAKHINQIKEDYITARLLLVQSQFRRKDFDKISKRTTFVNTLDYSIFNIYTGLLKSAFKEAFNILDKISRFINEYYKLGVKDDIYFQTIWQVGKKPERRIRPELKNSNNISLYALYDIFLDFYSPEYYKKFDSSKDYKKLKEIRNSAVHEDLVVYDSTVRTLGKSTSKSNNIEYNVLLKKTIELLQLVKASIIYLINFVEIEENKKIKSSSERIITIDVDTTQFL